MRTGMAVGEVEDKLEHSTHKQVQSLVRLVLVRALR